VRLGSSTLTGLFFLSLAVMAQRAPVPAPEEQASAAVLPLPGNMREKAGVLGYAPDMSVITLRKSTNGMICMGTRPGDEEFDVRCYHESFMPVARRLRQLRESARFEDINATMDAEIKSGKLTLPDHPTAGYRMLGPISAYNAATHAVGKEIESWQSVHFPYKTAAEIGLPEEGQVPRTMPYVMASGTFWSHVMIEHEPTNTK
jgi:hypothetical protein